MGSPEFTEAIRNYDWTLAQELCTTHEERQDITDSIERVDLMLKLKAEGRFDEALRLAVLTREADDINRARRAGGEASAAASGKEAAESSPLVPSIIPQRSRTVSVDL